jgi:electron transfer flavoprotein alpha subunit
MDVADYAVIGDLHAVVPAISAELRRRGIGVT